MATINYPVPQAGTDLNATADPEIATALTTIKTLVNGNIDGANVVASLTGRRLIATATGTLTPTTMTGALTLVAGANGGVWTSGSASPAAWLHLDPANFAVTGKGNTQLVLRMALAANATATGITITGSLNAATFVTGSASSLGVTAGAVQGSACSFASPGANSESVVEAGPFTFPSAGIYVPTFTTSAAAAANSAVGYMWQLFVVNS